MAASSSSLGANRLKREPIERSMYSGSYMFAYGRIGQEKGLLWKSKAFLLEANSNGASLELIDTSLDDPHQWLTQAFETRVEAITASRKVSAPDRSRYLDWYFNGDLDRDKAETGLSITGKCRTRATSLISRSAPVSTVDVGEVKLQTLNHQERDLLLALLDAGNLSSPATAVVKLYECYKKVESEQLKHTSLTVHGGPEELQGLYTRKEETTSCWSSCCGGGGPYPRYDGPVTSGATIYFEEDMQAWVLKVGPSKPKVCEQTPGPFPSLITTQPGTAVFFEPSDAEDPRAISSVPYFARSQGFFGQRTQRQLAGDHERDFIEKDTVEADELSNESLSYQGYVSQEMKTQEATLHQLGSSRALAIDPYSDHVPNGDILDEKEQPPAPCKCPECSAVDILKMCCPCMYACVMICTGCASACCSKSSMAIPPLPPRLIYRSYYTEDASVRVRFHSNVTIKTSEIVRAMSDLCATVEGAAAFVNMKGALNSLVENMYYQAPKSATPITQQVLALLTNLINVAHQADSDAIRNSVAKRIPALVKYAAEFEAGGAPFTSHAVRLIGCPTHKAHCYNYDYVNEHMANGQHTFNHLSMKDAISTLKSQLLGSEEVTFLYDVSGQYVRRDGISQRHATYFNLARMFRLQYNSQKQNWEVYQDLESSDPELIAFCHDDAAYPEGIRAQWYVLASAASSSGASRQLFMPAARMEVVQQNVVKGNSAHFAGSSQAHRATLDAMIAVLKPMLELPQAAQYLNSSVIQDVERIARRIVKRLEGPRVMVEGAYTLLEIVGMIGFKFKKLSSPVTEQILGSKAIIESLLQAFLYISADDLSECNVLRDDDSAGSGSTCTDYTSFLKFLELPLAIASWSKTEDFAKRNANVAQCLLMLQATIAHSIAPRLFKLVLNVTEIADKMGRVEALEKAFSHRHEEFHVDEALAGAAAVEQLFDQLATRRARVGISTYDMIGFASEATKLLSQASMGFAAAEALVKDAHTFKELISLANAGTMTAAQAQATRSRISEAHSVFAEPTVLVEIFKLLSCISQHARGSRQVTMALYQADPIPTLMNVAQAGTSPEIQNYACHALQQLIYSQSSSNGSHGTVDYEHARRVARGNGIEVLLDWLRVASPICQISLASTLAGVLSGQTSHIESFLQYDGLAVVTRLLEASKGLLREKLLDVVHAITFDHQGAAMFVKEPHRGQQMLQNIDVSSMTFMEHMMCLLCLGNLLGHSSLVHGGFINLEELVDYGSQQPSHYQPEEAELLDVLKLHRFPISELGAASGAVSSESDAWEEAKGLLAAQLSIAQASMQQPKAGRNVFYSYAWGPKEAGNTYRWQRTVSQFHEALNPSFAISMDIDNPKPGRILDMMGKFVREADVVVVFLSNEYAQSYNCRIELGMAAQLHRPLVFVEIDPEFDGRSAPDWLLAGMADGRRISCRNTSEFEYAVEQLQAQLNSIAQGNTSTKPVNLAPEVEYALTSLNLSQYGGRFRAQALYTMKDVKAFTDVELANATGLPLGSAHELLSSIDGLKAEYIQRSSSSNFANLQSRAKVNSQSSAASRRSSRPVSAAPAGAARLSQSSDGLPPLPTSPPPSSGTPIRERLPATLPRDAALPTDPPPARPAMQPPAEATFGFDEDSFQNA